ncbi:hypothetical protein LCGC14_3078810, partial [marine sediment metagenome]
MSNNPGMIEIKIQKGGEVVHTEVPEGSTFA